MIIHPVLKNNLKQFLLIEFLWWVITAATIVAFLYHPYKFGVGFEETGVINGIFILVFITVTRHLFFLKYSFVGYFQWLKVFIIILSIPLFMYLYANFVDIRVQLDDGSINEMFSTLNFSEQQATFNYVRNELIFFSVSSLIVTALLPVRMIVSIWRMRNRGTV